MTNLSRDIYLLIEVGLGSAIISSLITYFLVKGKIKSLSDSLDNAKKHIDKLDEELKKYPYLRKRREADKQIISDNKESSSDKTPKRTPLDKKDTKTQIGSKSRTSKVGIDVDNLPMDSISTQNQKSRDVQANITKETHPVELVSSNDDNDRLEDLKTLSKVIEEVESLTMSDDIFGGIDDTIQTVSGGLPVFERPFDETPNIKREDFKKFANSKILVAEDNPVNSKLIALLFNKSGIKIDIAEDGLITLNKAKEAAKSSRPYDLILMDVNMPNMNGLEATMAIRGEPMIQDTPILALTASTDQEEIEKILSSGMNGFLNKPIKLGKIFTAFNIFLDEAKIKKEKENQDRRVKQQERESQKQTDLKDVLNIHSGIEHTNHNENLYKSILFEFLQKYGNADKVFKDFIRKGDFKGLKAYMTDLEGLTGTIGADELYSIVKRINSLITKSEFNELQKSISRFQNSLKRLTEATKSYLKA